MTDHQQQQQQQTNTQASFNEILVQVKNGPTQGENVYAIHVPKFKMNITVDDIMEHIMNNIENADFNAVTVERLDTRNSNFISFKISTVEYDLYLKLMSIWSPHYTARNFNTNTNNSPYSSPYGNRKTPVKREQRFSAPRQYDTPRHDKGRYNNFTPQI